MNLFNFDLRKLVLVGFVLALPLISINMQRGPEESPWYMKPLSIIAGLAQNGYSSFSSGVRGTASLYLNLVGIKKANETLIRANQELRAQLGALGELKLENERLSELLNFKRRTNMELLAARVIGQDLLPDRSSIRINRGTRHGIKSWQAVITVEGVVGYVYRPDNFYSHVLLMTDNYAVIDGIVQRSRARGLVEGAGRQGCILRYLQRADDVELGDLVVTGGMGNIFPKGFPIGIVTKVERKQDGISQEVALQPVVKASHLEEVFVVLNAAEEEFSPEGAVSSGPGVTNPGPGVK